MIRAQSLCFCLLAAITGTSAFGFEWTVGREHGPDGLRMHVFADSGEPLVVFRADAMRLEPARIGFLRTNLFLRHTLSDVTLEVLQDEGFDAVRQWLSGSLPDDRMVVRNFSLWSERLNLSAKELVIESGWLRFPAGVRVVDHTTTTFPPGFRVRVTDLEWLPVWSETNIQPNCP